MSYFYLECSVRRLGEVRVVFVFLGGWGIFRGALINIQAPFYNSDDAYTILAHGYHGFSYQPNLHKIEIANKARMSGKNYIELLICEAGQHDDEFMINGKNIAEILHAASGMMVRYTEDYVHVAPLTGPYLENSPTAKVHGWKWMW